MCWYASTVHKREAIYGYKDDLKKKKENSMIYKVS